MASTTTSRLLAMLDDGGRPPHVRRRLVALIELLAELPPPPDPLGLLPRYGALRECLRVAMAGGSGELLEQAFLELYCHLHGHEAPYSSWERSTVDRTGGYWCHAGGLAPILMAPDWIRPGSRSVDLGAGNGLQLLLVQALAPHRCSVQVEISAAMCAAGRELQRWLGVPDDRVEWRQADVTAEPAGGFDFVYLYRPVRPDGPGAEFYRRLASELDEQQAPPVVFSIADCLGGFLSHRFERFYFDGHLACFRRDDGSGKRPPTPPPAARAR